MRHRKARFVGSVAAQADAPDKLSGPADLVMVERGVPRSIVMLCPDGCGEMLTINLDRRAGKAWRFYESKRGPSLYPSVWRTSGCRSHFIIWEGGIYWNDGADTRREAWEHDRLTEAVMQRLSASSFISFESIADELGEVPWAVASVCRQLARDGKAETGHGAQEGMFRSIGG